MFDGMAQLLAGWRTIAHVSEATGLSAGALVAISVLVYLDPRVLKPAIIAGAGVVLVYASLMVGGSIGRGEIEAEWADARKAAIAAQQERDAKVERNLAQKYDPQLAALVQQAKINKDQADAYERKLLAEMAKHATGGAKPRPSCELGALADRLHRGR